MVSKPHTLHVIVRLVDKESNKLGIFQNAFVLSENSLKTNICQENDVSSCSIHSAFQDTWLKCLKLRLFYLIWRKVYIVSKTELNFFKLKNLLCASCQT